jgi:DnaJ like chaperone protein
MKVFLTILALLYTLSPYDILPDFAIGWGWLDDLIILWLAWRFLYSGRGLAFRQRYFQSGPQSTRKETNEKFSDKKSAGSDPRGRTTESANDPFKILGIDRNASLEEIKLAYRQLANKYHPDKVEHLGDEFKALAEERFKEIESAYRELVKR